MSEKILEDALVGDPELVLRWRLKSRQLVLKDRYLRTLPQLGLPEGLISWIHQHIEWTLPEGSLANPHGVLQIEIDTGGRAQMEIVDFVPLEPMGADDLIAFAKDHGLHEESGIDSDVAWIVRDNKLIALTCKTPVLSGANSLVAQLADTLQIPYTFDEQEKLQEDDELFLVSDEYGFVPAADRAGSVSRKFEALYGRLLDARDRVSKLK